MGMFDKMLDFMKLGDDEDYYDDDDLYDDDEDDEPEEKSGSSFRLFGSKKDEQEDEDEEIPERKTVVREKPSVKSNNKITPMRGGRKASSVSMEVCVIKPASFEDAREISETLLADRTVILNMEGLDLGLAQRIIDFTSGCCYAIDGNLQKISNYIFIVTPAAVDISGDLQGIMDAFDFSGIQTGF